MEGGVVYVFNAWTGAAEADGSLSSGTALSTEFQGSQSYTEKQLCLKNKQNKVSLHHPRGPQTHKLFAPGTGRL